jgi:hypothetical protein
VEAEQYSLPFAVDLAGKAKPQSTAVLLMCLMSAAEAAFHSNSLHLFLAGAFVPGKPGTYFTGCTLLRKLSNLQAGRCGYFRMPSGGHQLKSGAGIYELRCFWCKQNSAPPNALCDMKFFILCVVD